MRPISTRYSIRWMAPAFPRLQRGPSASFATRSDSPAGAKAATPVTKESYGTCAYPPGYVRGMTSAAGAFTGSGSVMVTNTIPAVALLYRNWYPMGFCA